MLHGNIQVTNYQRQQSYEWVIILKIYISFIYVNVCICVYVCGGVICVYVCGGSYRG